MLPGSFVLLLPQLLWQVMCCRRPSASRQCNEQAAAMRQPTTGLGAACPAHLDLKRLQALLGSGRTRMKCAVSLQHDFIKQITNAGHCTICNGSSSATYMSTRNKRMHAALVMPALSHRALLRDASQTHKCLRRMQTAQFSSHSCTVSLRWYPLLMPFTDHCVPFRWLWVVFDTAAAAAASL
jgi:hypothetical protein